MKHHLRAAIAMAAILLTFQPCAPGAEPTLDTLRASFRESRDTLSRSYGWGIMDIVSFYLHALKAALTRAPGATDGRDAAAAQALLQQFEREQRVSLTPDPAAPEAIRELQKSGAQRLAALDTETQAKLRELNRLYDAALARLQRAAGNPAAFALIEQERYRLFHEDQQALFAAWRPTYSAQMSFYRETSEPGERSTERKPYVVVRVRYATDRKQTGKVDDPSHLFGDARGDITYGLAEVSIPKKHETGETEGPWLGMDFMEDPSKHIVLRALTPIDPAAFVDAIHAAPGDVLLFVHGFNMTFEDAARRTAQFAYDLHFDGTPLFFSWPSQGESSAIAYAKDETNARWSVAHLREVLQTVVKTVPGRKVHLIAHSMGARLLTDALVEMADPNNAGTPFNQIVLAAPDIDAEVFKRDIVPKIHGLAQRATMYASSDDKALRVSKEFHGYPRAGESGKTLVVQPGLDTVDATGIDTHLIGIEHSYFSASDTVLSDLSKLLRLGLAPDDRLLHSRTLNGLTYWVFSK